MNHTCFRSNNRKDCMNMLTIRLISQSPLGQVCTSIALFKVHDDIRCFTKFDWDSMINCFICNQLNRNRCCQINGCCGKFITFYRSYCLISESKYYIIVLHLNSIYTICRRVLEYNTFFIRNYKACPIKFNDCRIYNMDSCTSNNLAIQHHRDNSITHSSVRCKYSILSNSTKSSTVCSLFRNLCSSTSRADTYSRKLHSRTRSNVIILSSNYGVIKRI